MFSDTSAMPSKKNILNKLLTKLIKILESQHMFNWVLKETNHIKWVKKKSIYLDNSFRHLFIT